MNGDQNPTTDPWQKQSNAAGQQFNAAQVYGQLYRPIPSVVTLCDADIERIARAVVRIMKEQTP